MNNAKMWLVVKPTVGVPLFLSAVAVGSFAVHVAVLTNTSWVGDFLKGQPLGSGDQTAMSTDVLDENLNTASFIMDGVSADADKVLIKLPDGRIAVATLGATVDGPAAGALLEH